MPYIEQEERPIIDEQVIKLVSTIETVGQLNYAITTLLKKVYPAPNYSQHNEIVGVLECVKLEWYRRRSAVYEDSKAAINGDV